ncbi:winged helix-turn-helix transcriptional regulator [Nitrospira sp. M1]
MDKDGQRALLVLQEIEQNPIITQRSLSLKLGVALGLTNLYLKRLVRKGHIKVTTIPRNRIRYLLTPRGIKEKSRLTYEYLQFSLTYYRDVRRRLNHTLAYLQQLGMKRIVILGIGEFAEFAYLSLQDSELVLVGFVTEEPGDSFLSYPRGTLEVLKAWEFDAILISDLTRIDAHRKKLLALEISAEHVFSLV